MKEGSHRIDCLFRFSPNIYRSWKSTEIDTLAPPPTRLNRYRCDIPFPCLNSHSIARNTCIYSERFLPSSNVFTMNITNCFLTCVFQLWIMLWSRGWYSEVAFGGSHITYIILAKVLSLKSYVTFVCVSSPFSISVQRLVRELRSCPSIVTPSYSRNAFDDRTNRAIPS